MVIPQFLARADFLEQAERLAEQTRAQFHEVVLLDGKQKLLRRSTDRSRVSSDPVHHDAAVLVERAGGLDSLAVMYDNLVALVASRPRAKTVPITEDDVERTYADVIACLGQD
ncbi:MAG: hypothetical protein ACRDT6_03715 [Micromonosporaceae bacterium]